MSDSLHIQEALWDSRPVTVSWVPASFVPSRELTTQVYGVCFTEHRKIVLVTTGEASVSP